MLEKGETTLSDAAQRLGISWARAWRLVLTGELEGRKRQGRWYVSERTLANVERKSATSSLPNGGGRS